MTNGRRWYDKWVTLDRALGCFIITGWAFVLLVLTVSLLWYLFWSP